METNSEPIVVEQIFAAPVEVVWKAITDSDQMRRWFFETIDDFEPEVGFETEFNFRAADRDFLHQWKVTEVIPSRKIVYSWRYKGYPGDSSVVWELSETSDGTTLTFAHNGRETFPQDDPVFSRESGQAGWNYFIRERLRSFLEEHGA